MKKQKFYDASLNLKIDRDFLTRVKYFCREHNRFLSEVVRTGVDYYILMMEQKENEVDESHKKLIEKMVMDDIKRLRVYQENKQGRKGK